MKPEPWWKRTAAIAGAVIGAVLGSGLTVAVFNWYVSQDEVNAEQVRACMAQHQLGQARDTRVSLDSDTVLFVECEWPKPAYADRDGYSEVQYVSASGPGDSEASGATSADRLSTNCPAVRLEYLFGSQGGYNRLEPMTVGVGAVITVTGDEWTGEAPDPYPDRHEVVVLRNSKYLLERASCAAEESDSG